MGVQTPLGHTASRKRTHFFCASDSRSSGMAAALHLYSSAFLLQNTSKNSSGQRDLKLTACLSLENNKIYSNNPLDDVKGSTNTSIILICCEQP